MPPSSSDSTRRRPTQARALQTVEAILEAAAEVFDTHGFEAGTTERIVARAGVSIGSMYQYFPTKGALLEALALRHAAEVEAHQRAWLTWLTTTDPQLDEGLRAFIDWLVRVHAARPRLRCLLFEDRPLPEEVCQAMHSAHAATLAGLTTWLSGRVPRPHVTAALLHRAVPSLVHHFVLHPQPGIPPAVATEEVFTLARAYLAVAAAGAAEAGSGREEAD